MFQMLKLSKKQAWAFPLMIGLPLLLPFTPISPRLFSYAPEVLILLSTIFYLAFNRQAIKVDLPFLISSGCLFTIGALSYFWSIAPEETLYRTTKLFILFLSGSLLLHLSKNFSAEHLKNFYYIFLGCFVATAFVICFEAFSDHSLYKLIRSIDGKVNYSTLNWAMVILSILVWPLAFIMSKHNTKKALLPIVLLLSTLFFSFVTNSQSAQFGLFVGLAAATLSYFAKKPTIIFMMVAVSILLIGAPWIYASLFHNWPDAFVEVGKKAHIMQRLETWDFVAREVINHPLLGHGLETTKNMDFQFNAQQYLKERRILHPHSSVLHIWLELGLLGILPVLGMLLTLLKRLFDRQKGAFVFCATGCFTTCFFISLVGYGVWQGWLIITYMIAAAFFLMAAQKNKTAA